MKPLEIIFIKDPGVLGFIIDRYKNNVVSAKYYLDGISWTISLEEDEYSLFDPKENYDE